MKILESLYLKNVSVFKEAYLPLDTVGITQIRGNNKDSKNNTNKIDVNAVGKSLLLRAIPEIVFSSSPTTQDIKSRTKNDLITHSDSEYGITIRDKKTTYTFSKHANKKTYDYKLLENGKDSKVRTKAYTEDKIQKVFQYSEDEFYSIVFVDSRRTAKLQLGSPAQRIEFFTNLFRLNDYDSVRKIFSSKLTEARKSATILKEVNAQIDEISETDKDSNLKDLKKKHRLLADNNKNLVKKYDALHKQKSDLNLAYNNKTNFKAYKALVKDLAISSLNLDKQKDFLKNYIHLLEEKKKLVKAWDYYNTAKATYHSKFSKYVKDFESFEIKAFKADKVSDLIKFFKDEIKTLASKIFDAKDVINRTEDAKEPKFDAEKLKKLRKFKLKPIKEIKKEIDALESKVEIYSETITALGNLKGDNCPTCKQKINKKTCDNLSLTYMGKKKIVSDNIKDLKNDLEKATKLEELESENDGFTFAHKTYLEMMEALKKAKEVLKTLKPKHDKYSDALDVLTKIKNLEEPEKPKKKLKGEIKESSYKDSVKCLALLNIIYPIYDNLTETNFKTLDYDLEKLNKKLKNISSELDDISTKLSRLTSKIDLFESNLERLSKLNKRKEKLTKIVEEVPVIEAIIEAYSNKGIKLLIIKHIAAMIEKNINQYAPLLYSEPTKFKFEVVNDRNFNIMLCRTQDGKPSKPSDIRNLSGAEGRAFSFLLPLAILPLIPNERRLNIMVLDEPMQNMSDARKELFVESFIPKLNSIVPHLIILSTDNENYPNANVYTITKSKGVSTVTKS